ncbi:cytochrome c maturation protein CcmE [Gammaproteobacteria bacterium]|mgnify:FL=1|jgi:cytochrome c-type biogenesis protein CcmE|nr:cytochrome c maturation protein CcmE [Gammaproteobacteria bacterium]MDA9365270.1 cytochrome c maturation protein CcmE [Gammaproteobacteria bacterium]MDB9790793.1 cytochrome c maturation protein CcmE [Gammaproteobacteria bacterium]MDB9896497.1 cytochrome c maturation protein CcmE [Gammaproteobacteria bacterium]MDC1300912.1 cytochrome c maturation protein CcmE [Gammaproteobacteria bacterium]|tara:strand:- start:3609 stop:4013 length:405 start_codon:yes stop_codon:yes gene_type:complete
MRKSRKKRLQNFIIILLLSSAGVLLVLFSLNSKLDLFYSPTEMLLAQPHQESRIKLGGMVKTGSINRVGTDIFFVVTDFESEVSVTFRGITPDLFKEDSGVVALGYYRNQSFVAEEIFAKHDENYMPPELKKDS